MELMEFKTRHALFRRSPAQFRQNRVESGLRQRMSPLSVSPVPAWSRSCCYSNRPISGFSPLRRALFRSLVSVAVSSRTL